MRKSDIVLGLIVVIAVGAIVWRASDLVGRAAASDPAMSPAQVASYYNDGFGPINALLGFLGLVVVAVTLRVQQSELQLQRRELSLQREELNRSTQQLELQTEEMKDQHEEMVRQRIFAQYTALIDRAAQAIDGVAYDGYAGDKALVRIASDANLHAAVVPPEVQPKVLLSLPRELRRAGAYLKCASLLVGRRQLWEDEDVATMKAYAAALIPPSAAPALSLYASAIDIEKADFVSADELASLGLNPVRNVPNDRYVTGE